MVSWIEARDAVPSWGLRDRVNVSFSRPLTRGGISALDYREFMNFASWLENIASEVYQRFKRRYVSGLLTVCWVCLEGVRPAPPVFTLQAVEFDDVHWRRTSGLHTILRRNLSQHSRMNPWFTHSCGPLRSRMLAVAKTVVFHWLSNMWFPCGGLLAGPILWSASW